MKIVDMLEVADDYVLNEFRWGEGLVKHIKKNLSNSEDIKELSPDMTGNEAMALIESLDDSSYHKLEEQYVELELAESRLTKIKKITKHTATIVTVLAGGSFAWDIWQAGGIPDSGAVMKIVSLTMNFF